MYSFQNDYSEGAHPAVLEALTQTNTLQCEGYGTDTFCQQASGLLRDRFGCPDAAVHFFAGGTLTNLTALSSFLRPHEAVVAATSGHIAVHETGAVEATGHKVLTVVSEDGKVHPDTIRPLLTEHHFEHMVKPGLVYVSQSTELGTIYSRTELEALRALCDEKGLLLYLDGARLGAALCTTSGDLEPEDISRLCDAFYIGGTKNGALFGEALVICNRSLATDFRYLMKQKGALLAKGRTLGVQFQALFQDDLYFTLARHANHCAERIAEGIRKQGYSLLLDSPTNQVFPILPDHLIQHLEKAYLFYPWQKAQEDHTAIRLVTSWATPMEAVENFLLDLKQF